MDTFGGGLLNFPPIDQVMSEGLDTFHMLTNGVVIIVTLAEFVAVGDQVSGSEVVSGAITEIGKHGRQNMIVALFS